jgi:cell division protein FtsB
VAKKKRQGIVSLPKVVTVVTLTLVAVLTVDFGRKALDNYRIQNEVERLRRVVQQEKQTNEELQTELDHVSSDAYAEEIARERLKLVQPGETSVVVVLQPAGSSPDSGDLYTAEATPKEPAPYWRQWAILLLGVEE